jgi:hypothetical protein
VMMLACQRHGAELRDNAEQLETFKKVMADFKTKQSQAASENGEFVIWQPHQISDEATTSLSNLKAKCSLCGKT